MISKISWSRVIKLSLDRWKIKKSHPSKIPRCWQVLIAVGCTVLALASIQLTLLWTDALTLDHILAIRNVMGRHGRVHEEECATGIFTQKQIWKYLPKPKLLDRPSLTKTQRVTIVFNFAISTHVQCQHKDHEAKNVARYEKPLSVSIFIKYGKFWITSLSHIIKHKLLISEECKYSFTDVLLKLSLWCNNFKTG